MKILLFGVPGSGKTYLAHTLSKKLEIPIFHIDKHFFEKGWIERDHDHFLADVNDVLRETSWIIDGNGMKTLEMRYSKADIAIYCCLPRIFCLYRIFYRFLTTLGKEKVDGPDGSKNSISWKLISYLWNFKKRYNDHIWGLKKKYPEVDFLHIQKNLKRSLW